MSDELLTQDELARRLGVSTYTVARWRRSGSIPFTRLGGRTVRFDFDAVVRAREAITESKGAIKDERHPSE